jgi:hypothetical protein
MSLALVLRTVVGTFKDNTVCSENRLQKVLEVMSTSASLRDDFDGLSSIESEMSINFLSLSLDGLPLLSVSKTEAVSRNFLIRLRNALR